MLKKCWKAIQKIAMSIVSPPPQPSIIRYERGRECKMTYTGPEYWSKVSSQIKAETVQEAETIHDVPQQVRVLEDVELSFEKQVKEWKQNNARVDDYFNKRYSVA